MSLKNIRIRNTAFLLTLCLSVLFSMPTKGQERISGKSKKFKFDYKPIYERGMPPNLFVDMRFTDNNGNGIIESLESSMLTLKITNRGVGKAQGLNIKLKDSYFDKELNYEKPADIFFIESGETRIVEIPIKAGVNVKTAEHKIEINVTEHFGYDMDPAFLVLNTLEFQKPQIVFSGYEILDHGKGTAAIVEDGQLQAGELVKLKIVVQNIGQNVAQDLQYKLTSTDNNIFIEEGTGKLGEMAIGEVKDFWVTLSPNKRVEYKNELPVYLTVTSKHDFGNLTNHQLPIVLNQKPPTTQTLAVEANIEKLARQVARFEYRSNKFTANVGTVKNIATVVRAKTKRENSVAVVFGIESYTNLPPAPYADNDAEIFSKYLKDRLGVEKVVVYKNEEVSGFIFDNVFNPDNGELQRAIVKGETDLFVFYSGHGIPSKDGQEIFLFPSDGRIDRLSIQGYNINTLYQNLEKLDAKSTTVIIDACFSGTSRTSERKQGENLVATKGVWVRPKILQPWQRNSNFTVINSSGLNETSLGFDPSQTGLFTYYICLGLQGEADLNNDNRITTGELYQFVSEKVQETSKKIFGVQTPQFNGNQDMILVEF